MGIRYRKKYLAYFSVILEEANLLGGSLLNFRIDFLVRLQRTIETEQGTNVSSLQEATEIELANEKRHLSCFENGAVLVTFHMQISGF